MVANKRGFTTVTLIVLIFTCLVLMGILGITTWTANLVDESFSGIDDFNIGNQSFQGVYNETLKPGLDVVSTTMPQIISMGTMLGMVILMMLIGYFSAEIGRMWLMIDIAFMIIAEAIASAVSSGFVSYMNSTPELLAIYSNTLSEGAAFVINLPIIIPPIGMLIMLATYIKVKKNRRDLSNF